MVPNLIWRNRVGTIFLCALVAVLGALRLRAFHATWRASANVEKAAIDRPLMHTAPEEILPGSRAAFARQQAAATRLLADMRSKPDDWEHDCLHRPTSALWIDPFRDFYHCPAPVEKIGSLSDGGKWVCGLETLLQIPGCVVYSFGSNGDTAFEEAILEYTSCSVFTFDPTLNDTQSARVAAVPAISFSPVGLSDADGLLTIKGKPRPVRTLQSLMQENGHSHVDLIKIDIEGGEWSALDGMIAGGKRLPLTQALIEFHVIQPQSSIETMAGLQALGMQVFHVEENNYCTTCYNTKARGKYYEVSFANTHKDGSLFLRPQQG